MKNKPWYKVWWIWAIIVIAFIMILAVIGGGSDSSSSSSSSDSSSSSAASTKKESNPLDKTYKVGDTVNYKGFKIKVNKVSYYSGNDMDTPDSGKQYVIANVTLTNDSSEKQDYNEFDFKLNSDGNSEDIDNDITEGQYSQNFMQSGTLDPKSSLTANLEGQAPTNAKSLQLRYQPTFFDDKTLDINLK